MVRKVLGHPEDWTDDDLAVARSMLENQARAVAQTHPKDREGRERLQEVVDRLEAAIQAYLARRT